MILGVGCSVGVWNELSTPATSATGNGNFWNPCCHRPNRADGLSPTPGGRSSTPSATFCAPAAPGECCPTTCRPGASSSTTSAPGVATELGNGPTTPCTPRCDKLRAAKPVPARRSSTANRSRPRKKGAQRVRRRQTGERAQAAHRGGYPGTAAGSGGAPRRCTGPRWCPVGPGQAVGPVSQATANLGRWGLWRQIGKVGQDDGRLDPGTGAPSGAATYLPSAPPAVGRGANLRLAKPATALEQGLRVIVRNYRSLDPHLNDWPHVKETGPPSVFLDTL